MTSRRVVPAGRSGRAAERRQGPGRVGARVAALVAVALLGVVLTGVGAGPASAAPSAVPVQDRSTGPVVLTLDALSPRVVTADGPGELLLSGRLRNVGSETVRDVSVRVQRGPALTGERDVANALTGADPAAVVRVPPTELAPGLLPGQELPFAVRVPLRGTADSLALATAGVYPMVVSTPTADDGGEAGRVGAVRFQLPVLGLPPSAPGARAVAPAAPPVGRAERVSVLYPLADRPRRLPVAPGAPTLLTDDTLADAFAPGGRLDGLVDALGRAAPVGSPAAASVCVAVDADLLETAAAMVRGYQVATPAGTVDGRGATAAGSWLAATATAVRGRCVVALPFADADLVTTSRGNLTDLTTTARTSGARRVADLLGATPLADTTWPAGGVLDERTLADLATGGARTLVVDGAAVATGDGTAPAGSPVRLDSAPDAAVLAVPTDPLVAGALAGVRPAVGALGTAPAGSAGPLAAQDALAALVLRATTRPSGSSPGAGTAVVAPPPDWGAGADGGSEAAQLLDTVGDLAASGLLAPVDLAVLTGGGPSQAPAATLTPAVGPGGVDDATLARARTIRDRQRDLLAASVQDRTDAPTPAEFVEPLTGDLLRSLTAFTRTDAGARADAVTRVGTQMDALRASVRVVQPSGPYSLGSNDAPLLLTVDNRLPVAMTVAVALAPTPGLRTSAVAPQVVPAFGSRQFQVGIQVIRSGQFSVDAQAMTPGGELLGPTGRLLLRSTAYGTITVWLTASAGVVLVILATVRIVRRVRAARRDRPGRPHPTAPTPGDPSSRQLQDR